MSLPLIEKPLYSFPCKAVSGERRSWDVCFTRDLNDWELDLVVDFLHILEPNTPSTERGDHMRWKLKKNEDFDTRFIMNCEVLFHRLSFERYLEIKAPR